MIRRWLRERERRRVDKLRREGYDYAAGALLRDDSYDSFADLEVTAMLDIDMDNQISPFNEGMRKAISDWSIKWHSRGQRQ